VEKSTGLTVAVALLLGCGSALAQFAVDVSVSEQTVRINKDPSCRIYWPYVADSIIVDAGPVLFASRCSAAQSIANQIGGVVGDVFGGPSNDAYIYTFRFVAEPGRTYEVDGACVRMASPDAAVDGDIVACEPGISGRIEGGGSLRQMYDCEIDRSRRSETERYVYVCVGKKQTATVRPGGTTSYQDTCWPSAGRMRGRVVLRVIDAGPTSMDATCDRILQTGEWTRKTSSFDFNAETGHIYTLSGEAEECMRLIDITSVETVIACEPYHEEPIR